LSSRVQQQLAQQVLLHSWEQQARAAGMLEAAGMFEAGFTIAGCDKHGLPP
jgi:hypothetical protein